MSSSHKASQQSGFFEQVKQIAFILLVVFLIRTFIFGLYQVPTGSMETTMLVGERFFADKFTYLFTNPKHEHIIALNSPLFAYSDNTLIRLFQEYVWGPQNLTKRVIGVPGDLIEGKIEDGKPVIYRNGQKLHEPYLNKYPLIAVFKTEPNELVKNVTDEAISLMSQNKLSPTKFESFLNKKLKQDILSKSYDPNKSYEDQPFYRMKESLIYKVDGHPMLIHPGSIIERPQAGNEAPAGDNAYWDGTDIFRVKLGDNQYWLMGDNRLNSGDSRMFGPIDRRLIHGRILFRIWSIDSGEDWWILDLIRHPIDFWTRIRWNRFLQFIS
jgi:signal peptidase I